jgi:phage FluMu protein Com
MPSSPQGLRLVESVRCLECGAVYAKPAGGGVVQANPGCPECGYVGWVTVKRPATPPTASPEQQHRLFAGLLRRRSA